MAFGKRKRAKFRRSVLGATVRRSADLAGRVFAHMASAYLSRGLSPGSKMAANPRAARSRRAG